MKKVKDDDYLKTFAIDLFAKLEIPVEVSVEKEDGTYKVNLEGENLGMIIGHHGNTLNSFEHIISLVMTYHMGEYHHVRLDAGDWRKNREEQLERMVDHAIKQVLTTGKDYDLPPMSPAERRMVHLKVSENTSVTSQSAGEGNFRHIVVKKVG